MVGDGDLGRQKCGKHLAPARRGFRGLIGDGGIAEQEQRRHVDGRDRHGAQAGRVTQHLDRQPVVPVEGAELAGLQPHRTAAGRIDGRRCQLGVADVHDEPPRDDFAGTRADRVEHQAAVLRFDRRVGRMGGIAQRDRHRIIAGCRRDGKEMGIGLIAEPVGIGPAGRDTDRGGIAGRAG